MQNEKVDIEPKEDIENDKEERNEEQKKKIPKSQTFTPVR